MPVYEYKCKNCSNQFEVYKPVALCGREEYCPKCNTESNRQWNTKLGKDWFRPHWNENLDTNPIFVESKKHYKKLCKERGMVAQCLL